MNVIALRPLREFWERHPESAPVLQVWYHRVSAARWQSAGEIKQQYATASIINEQRVVFNVGGNKYRIVVRINYGSGTVFVRFVGTHREYDAIDAETV